MEGHIIRASAIVCLSVLPILSLTQPAHSAAVISEVTEYYFTSSCDSGMGYTTTTVYQMPYGGTAAIQNSGCAM